METLVESLEEDMSSGFFTFKYKIVSVQQLKAEQSHK